MPGMRLDKLLTHMNCGSRREVAAWVRAGRVAVDGAVCRDPAYKVDPDRSCVLLDGQAQAYRAQRYLMLNKPAGVITASHDPRHQTVLDLIPESGRRGLFAVGRLDKDTEGLLLLTTDGAFSHALMAPGRHVEKEYLAEVEGTPAADAAEQFARGIVLKDGTVCRPARLEPGTAAQTVRVTLCEGKYHQVKRMLWAVGCEVTRLKRMRVGPLVLDETLAPGAFRELSDSELAAFGIPVMGDADRELSKK